MIERFSCRHFRNLEPLDWRPDAGPQVVMGANGGGKTSLLEALYLLATSRSFRGARPAECCRRGATAFFLEADVAGERRARLAVGWTAEGGLERQLNGKSASLADYLALQPVVAWSAADAELLDGPPLLRRRLLDQGVVAARPAALGVLARYRQALEQKRRLLAEDLSGLGPWNELLAAAAAELVALRRDQADRLGETLARVLAGSDLDLGTVELVYRPSVDPGEEGAAAILARLEEVRGGERRQRRPLLGPHRDDLEVLWQGHGLRRTASAGEKKLLGLALTAARGRLLGALGRQPLYLLDDADGDLDRRRLATAWGLFEQAPQLIATSHRPEAWKAVSGIVRRRLEGGRLEPAGGS
ncbi:MAG: DNA replication/repair protein RecF [Thermoanaerobaculia bacterium]